MIDPLFIIVDLFCGAGGTTTGFEMAEINGSKIAKVIACVNHDHKAIKSHWLNHPEVKHFEEDIRTLDLKELVNVVKFQRELYPEAKLILWASLECTNFSKAKGGLARDADSRTLAETLYMHYDPQKRKYHKGDSYLQLLDPDYLMIENVVEFMSWGPLVAKTRKTKEGYLCCDFRIVNELERDFDENDNLISERETGNLSVVVSLYPESRKNGSDWMRWRKEICALGYADEWKEMNSANYGAYTSRNRLFGCFTKPGNIMCWPEPTHAKNPSKLSMYGDLKKWKPVKEVLNFSDEGESIFTRKKPLSDKTLERIYAGLIKFVAKGDTSFISKYYSGRPSGKVASVDDPSGVITSFGGQTLVQPISILKYNSTNKNGVHIPPSVEEPCPVVSTHGTLGLVQGEFIIQRNGGNPESKVVDVDGPARTITATGGNQELVQPEFIASYYGNGDNISSIENPAPTIPTKDRCALVQPKFLINYNHSSKCNDVEETAPTLLTRDKLGLVQSEYFIDKHFGTSQNQSIEQPAGSILPTDKHRLVQCDPFIMPTAYDNKPKSIEEPAPTITANRKYHYLINPSHGGHTQTIEAPCPVIIARQDKAPLYFVQVESGSIAIAVFDNDSEICIKIKQFMAVYNLVDIKMRMLRVPELLLIQGLMEIGGKEYLLEGNQSDQKKFIGNSVHPYVPQHWAEAMGYKLLLSRKVKVA